MNSQWTQDEGQLVCLVAVASNVNNVLFRLLLYVSLQNENPRRFHKVYAFKTSCEVCCF